MMNNLSGASQKPNVVKYKLYLSSQPSDQQLDNYHKFVEKIIDNKTVPVAFRHHPRRSNYLYGSTSVEGRVEDEWLIVYTLFKLSEHDDDLVIKVFDNDGDILLIEAAEHLPRWLESRESKNRTFIHSGNVHIIPKHVDLRKLRLADCSSSSDSEMPLAQVAANFVRNMNRSPMKESGGGGGSSSTTTLASSNIQKAIKKQLTSMPDKSAWLKRMYQQLDDIISNKECLDLKDKFNSPNTDNKPLTLGSIMKMSDDELATSPINSSSPASSTAISSPQLSRSSSSSSSTSSLCFTEQQND